MPEAGTNVKMATLGVGYRRVSLEARKPLKKIGFAKPGRAEN